MTAHGTASLVRRISHDLQQPLVAVRQLFDLIEDQGLSEPQRNFAAKLHGALDAASALLDSLSHMAALELGQRPPRPAQEFEMLPVVRHVAARCGRQAEAKGIRLSTGNCGGAICRGLVQTDPVLLEHMLEALLSTAIRHCAGGALSIRCRCVPGVTTLTLRGRLEVSEETRSRLGEGFAVSYGEAAGADLDLATVAHFARLAGYGLVAEQATGQGTALCLRLPRAALPAEEPQPGSRAVLVVQPDHYQLLALQIRLEGLGWTVLPASGYEQAVGSAALPGLIVTDQDLAHGRTGLDLVTALRQRHGAVIPAILLATDAASAEAAKLDSCLVLTKHCSGAHLTSAILQAAGQG